MPSVSASQQRYFGAIKGGAIPKPKGMTDQVVDEFASTPRTGLPERAPKPHMADGGGSGHWAARAFANNKGGLHRALNVPEGKTIPAYRVKAAAHSNSSHLQHMAQAALNMNKRHYYGAK